MKREADSATFDQELLNLVNRSVKAGDVVMTLGKSRPNRIAWINEDGVWVSTEKSDSEGTGPQLVPAWMIAAGWHHLVLHGRLSQQQLLEELNVKRSAFVCALLALFPDVEVENGIRHSTQPVALLLSPRASDQKGSGSPRDEHPNPIEVPRSMERRRSDATAFFGRLDELLESNPYSTEDFADALSDQGIIMAREIATRLLAAKGGLPSESVIEAVARVFDVEPEYFFLSADPSLVERPSRGPSEPAVERSIQFDEKLDNQPVIVARQLHSNLAITLPEFGTMIEALSIAVDRYLSEPESDAGVAVATTRRLSTLGKLLADAQGQGVSMPRAVLEEVVVTWARMGPSDNDSRTDFLWLAELLGKKPAH